jgi:DNA-binding GntR family transcriptional regulator
MIGTALCFIIFGSSMRTARGLCRLPVAERRETGIASKIEADRLKIRTGTNVLRIIRVRSFGAVPTIAERLVAGLFPGLFSENNKDLPSLLYEHYGARYGIIVAEAEERLRAVSADEIDRKLLGMAGSQPLLETALHLILGKGPSNGESAAATPDIITI